MSFNFAERLLNELTRDELNKLTRDEWKRVSYLIKKAQKLYDTNKDSEARKTLESAVVVLKAHGEYSAANKVQYYIRFT